MARIKYDVSDVESTVFEQPKPGLYPAKIESAEHGPSKAGNPQLTLQIRITSGEFKGALLWHYVPTDQDAPGYFRMAELIKVLGVKAKGTIDTDKMEDTAIQVRVKPDSYNGEYRARVGALLPAGDDGDDDDEDLAEPDDDDGDEPEAEAKPARRSRRKRSEPEPEPEPDDDDDDDAAEPEGEGEGGDDEDDYPDWSVDELKNELKERGLRTAGSKDALIKRLRKDDEDEEDPFS